MLRHSLSCAAFLLLTGLCPARQRFLIIDVDDVGRDLIEETPTPILDRIAAAGLTLSNFYSAPLCSPSRVRLQLGARASHPSVLVGVIIECDDPSGMPLQPLVPLGALLSSHGVTTAKIGKWHLGGVDPLSPNRAGWQHYSGVLDNPSACGTGTYFDFERVTNGVVEHVTGEYLTEVETNDAIAAVRAGYDVVSLSYHAVHDPLHVPPPHLLFGRTPTKQKEMRRAMLRALDHEIGRAVQAALVEGYTVLVFSDSGTATKTKAGERPSGKGTVYESGVRVPCFAIGPGVAPGVTSEALYAWEDVYATVADAFAIPTGANAGPDSVSFLDELTSPDGLGRRWNYAERWSPNGWDPRIAGTWKRAIRDARYKVVRDQTAEGEQQFYDLRSDPDEEIDLLVGGLTPEQQEAYDALTRALDRM